MNYEYRPQLLEKISGVILLGDQDISIKASLYKWLGIRKIYWINMYIDFEDKNSFSSIIESDYVDQFRYTQHLRMIGPVIDDLAIFIISHCPCLLSMVVGDQEQPIPQVTDINVWASLTTGAWCWYNNDSITYAATYGRLYNWYAVAGIYDAASEANPALRKQLAPTGWHVASDNEWNTLINFLDPFADGGQNDNIAGGMMKTIGTIEEGTGLWKSPNFGASNVSGFSGVPGGFRCGSVCSVAPILGYSQMGSFGSWWSSSEFSAINAWSHSLGWSADDAYRSNNPKRNGNRVRCLKD
jgi:uncharacterized protein (TIGR02145 family)